MASLGAHPAVLIVGGVVLALVAAQTASLGAVEISRMEFLARIADLCRPPTAPQRWRNN